MNTLWCFYWKSTYTHFNRISVRKYPHGRRSTDHELSVKKRNCGSNVQHSFVTYLYELDHPRLPGSFKSQSEKEKTKILLCWS